jgi:hypothetical protein
MSGGYVAVENDGVDTNRVYVTKDRVEGRQVAMNVGQHCDPHEDPFRSLDANLRLSEEAACPVVW